MTKPNRRWFRTATRTLGALALLVVGAVRFPESPAAGRGGAPSLPGTMTPSPES